MPQPGFSSLIQGQIFDIVKGMVARMMVTFLWRMDVKDGYSITDLFLFVDGFLGPQHQSVLYSDMSCWQRENSEISARYYAF